MSDICAKPPIQLIIIVASIISIITAVPLSEHTMQMIRRLTTNEVRHDPQDDDHRRTSECLLLPPSLAEEISSYSVIHEAIRRLVLNGPFKGQSYRFLAQFTDQFGARLTGSETLEQSIDYLLAGLEAVGLDNVHGEQVTVPIWKRGEESLQMIRPRAQKMSILGLGTSIGTPYGGITAEIVVVNSFDDLHNKSDQVLGKIVVYNQPYDSYGNKSQYRVKGAAMAASYGAVAVLVRSVTPSSIYSPHTGFSSYEAGVTKIPAACITVEDAELFQRIVDRGETVIVKLEMGAQNFLDGTSRNTVAELTGRSKPEEVVIISGHLDSWDVGQGAMDDGGGAIISVLAQMVLQNLPSRPRRTVRSVLWTGEEFDYVGAAAYREAHRAEWNNINIVLESDMGTFDPTELTFSGTPEATCIVKAVVDLMAPMLNATSVSTPDTGSDTSEFNIVGIPTASLIADGGKYFNFHHSQGDTMSVQDADQMDRCLVVWAFMSYVLADLSVRLPRNDTSSTTEHSNVI